MRVRHYFSLPLYICIYINKITIRTLDGSDRFLEAEPDRPFSTKRLLIADFTSAESTLTEAVEKLRGGGILRKSFRAVIHPIEMSQGGLSEVEEKALRELACSVGAHHHAIHIGSILSQHEALAKISS
ncbi:MAG: hypothetical protein V7720_03210 [Halioglobus sp.]